MIEQFGNLDRQLLLAVNSMNAGWLNPVMSFLSGQVLWVPLIIFFLWYCRKNFDLNTLGIFTLFLILAVVASDVTSSYLLKNYFQRLRPCRLNDLRLLLNQFGQKCGGKYGLVSSHAANSAALIAYSLRSLDFKHKAVWLLWLLPLVVSWSRIYLGVHYPGDVLGGMAVGLFWAYTFSTLFRLRR